MARQSPPETSSAGLRGRLVLVPLMVLVAIAMSAPSPSARVLRRRAVAPGGPSPGGTSLPGEATPEDFPTGPIPGKPVFHRDVLPQLSAFPYPYPEPGTRPDPAAIPDEVRAMDGAWVLVKGYMVPLEFDEGLTSRFLLMTEDPSCCFGRAMAPNSWVEVELPEGVGAEYASGYPLDARGTLEVGERFDEYGALVALYRLKARSLQRAGNANQDLLRPSRGGTP